MGSVAAPTPVYRQPVAPTLTHDIVLLGRAPDGRAQLPDLRYLAVGAALAELAARGRVGLHGRRVVVLDPTPSGDEVLDAVLDAIAQAPRPRSGRVWVVDLAGPILDRQLDALVAAGTLRREREVVLLGMVGDIFPVADVDARDRLVHDVQVVVIGGAQPTPRTRTLLSLIRCAYGSRRTAEMLFPGVSARALRARLRELADDHWTTTATARAIQLARAH